MLPRKLLKNAFIRVAFFILCFFSNTACEKVAGFIEYQPPLIPLKITINTWGEIDIETSTRYVSPIGVFEVGLMTEADRFFDTVENTLTIRIDNEECMYDLGGNDFDIKLSADEQYQLLALKKEGKDLFLELISESNTGCTPRSVTYKTGNGQTNLSDSLNEIDCPGASPSYLSLGSTAYVSYFQVKVYQEPSERSALVRNKYLAGDRIVNIIDGPVCGEGVPGHVLFWKIRSEEITFSNGARGVIVGWIPEESGDDYLLKPR